MPRGRRLLVSVVLVGVASVCACTGSPAPPEGGSTSAGGETPASSSSSPATAAPSSSSPATAASSPTPTASCADTLVNRLTPEQRVGQLLMVGAPSEQGAASLDPVLRDQHVGGVVLLGSWTGAGTVRAANDHWQQTSRAAAGGVGVAVAADQEGGQVQVLKGAGFASTSAALTQGRDPVEAGRTAATVGRQLGTAGVSIALAPVTDTVAASFASRNGPIGRYQREYGNTPQVVVAAVQSVVTGLQGAGVSATLKHFPGLGRVTGNTDVTADGTTDTTTTGDDAYLEPFRAGVRAGADLVMISSALYPKLDPGNRGVFSAAIVTDLLRGQIGFGGVVISDDIGAARSVSSIPVGERATRFVDAGGDLVLTATTSAAAPMAKALRDKAAVDPTFAAKVDAAARRVVDLKVRRGLAGC